VSLPELLAIEQEISAAHLSLEGKGFCPCSSGELLRLLAVADRLRAASEICVVLGGGKACLAARAALELLQGRERNLTRGSLGDPRIFFAGDSFSTRQWNRLKQQLEGKEFSVMVLSGDSLAPETAAALRNLKWMLDRRYGTDEAGLRVCAVTDPENGPLQEMARLHNWDLLPQGNHTRWDALSPAALLPMAVAGLDAAGLLAGAEAVREELELRSFENPLWLYAAVRSLMHRRGKKGELISAREPDFHSFGLWWQTRFFPSGIPVISGIAPRPHPGLFITALGFAPDGQRCEISPDVHDLDGLNALAGRSLEEVQESAFLKDLENWADAGIPVLTMDCGPLEEQTLGALFYFLILGSALSEGICGVAGDAPDV
jgi:glucose-6-phosphate isomerase